MSRPTFGNAHSGLPGGQQREPFNLAVLTLAMVFAQHRG